eukprot:CAMPEP_0172836380 /NCGR_PEP_ID=MMETSP1075-20121228/26451_1 /TAXON_ID=2916 /ORGANISM="Ceratium fusus, Strain PA161109" /LENGTH=66 /DNA_ID=CAMNT_0013679597 /DNA_START=171 /DNA_END=368 /DNA_ORIENTATION=-
MARAVGTRDLDAGLAKIMPWQKLQGLLRQLRLEVEKRSFAGGFDEALGHAARAVVVQIEFQGIQVL